jgi:hypothetical protein
MDRVLTSLRGGMGIGDDRLRFPLPRLLDEVRSLFEGDMVFFADGDGDGSSGDGAPGGDDGGAPGGGDGDGDGAQDGDDDDKETLTPENARKLRSEAKNLRERLKAEEAKRKELEDKDLEEGQRNKRDLDERTKRVAELERENRDLQVRFAAIEAGIRPKAAAAAAALINWDDVDASDEKAVLDALKGLKKEHEYLFAVETDDAKGDGKKKPPAGGADGGSKGSDSSKSDVSPGAERLRQAYATKD